MINMEPQRPQGLCGLGKTSKYYILAGDKSPGIRASLGSRTLGYTLSDEAICKHQFLVNCYNPENMMFQLAKKKPPFLCLI